MGARSRRSCSRRLRERESCRLGRHEQCATFFARWGFDYPESPRLRATVAEVRKASGGMNPKLTPAQLNRLWTLFSGKLPEVGEEAYLRQAQGLTSRFLAHYQHAVPFDRRVLEAAWSRCRGEDCEEARRQSMQRLGAPDDDAWARDAGAGVGQHLEPEAAEDPIEPGPEPEGRSPSRAAN